MEKLTIKQMAYLLIDKVNGGMPTDDSKINYRIAKAYILDATAYFLRKRYWEEKKNSDENYSSNITTKQVDVKYDEDNEQYYVDVLGESIDTGGMSSYSISALNPTGRWALTFVPVKPEELFNQGLMKKRIPDTVQYYKVGDRLVFTNMASIDQKPVLLSQANLLPNSDEDALPRDIGLESVSRAWREYMGKDSNQDRDNNGVSSNLNER